MPRGADTPPRKTVDRLVGQAVRAVGAGRPDRRRKAAAEERVLALPDDPVAGAFASPQPTGFGPLVPPALHPLSPGSVLADTEVDVKIRREAPVVGVPDQTVAKPPPRRPPPASPRSTGTQNRGLTAWLGSRTSDTSLTPVRETVSKPELSATMSQRVAAEEAGRAAIAGDRLSLRVALADLVEKLDLSSPKDSAVLIPDGVAQQVSGGALGWIDRGKMTVEMTQGGRLFGQLAPVVKSVAKIDVQGELDGAWGAMSERFAKGAKGTVDIVMPEGAVSPESRRLTITEVQPHEAGGVDSVDLTGQAEAKRLAVREVEDVSEEMEAAQLKTGQTRQGMRIKEVPAAEGADGTAAVDLRTTGDPLLRITEVEAGSEASPDVRLGTDQARSKLSMTEVESDNPRVAGKLTLQEVVERNPDITEVRMVEVPASSTVDRPAAGRTALRLSRDALLKRFGLGN